MLDQDKQKLLAFDVDACDDIEQFNYIVGLAAGIDVFFDSLRHKCLFRDYIPDTHPKDYYVKHFDPCHNANQCLELTPKCEVHVYSDHWAANFWIGDEAYDQAFALENFAKGPTELIARCKAYVAMRQEELRNVIWALLMENLLL